MATSGERERAGAGNESADSDTSTSTGAASAMSLPSRVRLSDVAYIDLTGRGAAGDILLKSTQSEQSPYLLCSKQYLGTFSSVFHDMFELARPASNSPTGVDQVVDVVGLDDDEAALDAFLRLIFEPPHDSETHRRILPTSETSDDITLIVWYDVWPVCQLAHKYDTPLLLHYVRTWCWQPADNTRDSGTGLSSALSVYEKG